jgi:hypothetical protein
MQRTANDTSAQEIIEKGDEIYNRRIRPKVEAANMGRLVAIDVNTEDFEIGDEVMDISRRLLDRKPDAEIATLRIGGGPVYQIGMLSSDGSMPSSVRNVVLTVLDASRQTHSTGILLCSPQ